MDDGKRAVKPTEPCGRELVLAGQVIAVCNLRKGHLGKCAEVDWT